ncbi:MAG: ComF family protein [Patescibacteria group bacterium]|nr:ComF family protein [Patescibacteria group bacterium]
MFARLLDLVFPPRADEFLIRGLLPETLSPLVEPRTIPDTTPETVGLLPFHDPHVRALIHEAKYHGNERAFSLLSDVLADYLLEAAAEEGFANVVVVPVPLSASRRAKRGFNQTEEVGRRACAAADVPFAADALLRVRDTESQVALPREKRLTNMRGAFACAYPPDPAHTYIVLDDVVTTGATLQAALDALVAAGASRVIPLALAR